MSELNALLEQIAMTPGARAALALRAGHVCASSGVDPAVQSQVEHAVQRLAFVHQVVERAHNSAGMTVIAGTKGSAQLIPLGDSNGVVLLADADLEPQMVEITIGAVRDQLRAALGAPENLAAVLPIAPAAAKPPPPPPGVAAAPSDVAFARSIPDSDAKELRKAMARFVGPAAPVLWRRHYKAWRKGPDGSLEALFERLSSEIDSPKDRREFLTLTRDYVERPEREG
jgi:hypothetical protein